MSDVAKKKKQFKTKVYIIIPSGDENSRFYLLFSCFFFFFNPNHLASVTAEKCIDTSNLDENGFDQQQYARRRVVPVDKRRRTYGKIPVADSLCMWNLNTEQIAKPFCTLCQAKPFRERRVDDTECDNVYFVLQK